MEGDANFKYFHNVMKARFRRNSILGLSIVRGRIEDVGEIKIEVKTHFANNFFEPLPLKVVFGWSLV